MTTTAAMMMPMTAPTGKDFDDEVEHLSLSVANAESVRRRHTPQASSSMPDLTTPSHPVHVELSPPHTSHASNMTPSSHPMDVLHAAGAVPVWNPEHIICSGAQLTLIGSGQVRSPWYGCWLTKRSGGGSGEKVLVNVRSRSAIATMFEEV